MYMICVGSYDMMSVIVVENFDEMTRAILGYSNADLDGLFEHIRARETNLGERQYTCTSIYFNIDVWYRT